MIKKARTPEFWEKIKNNPDCENIIKLLKRHYDEASGTDMGVLTFSAYNRYFEDGNRSEYEEIYFDRRKKLAVFAMMSLLYPENKEYLIKLQDVISAVLDEYCWALPAHMKDNIEPDSTLIDLFAAETGITLCEILFLIGDRLHPLIRKRIKAELERRIINSYLERENEFWWEGTDGSRVFAAVPPSHFIGTAEADHMAQHWQRLSTKTNGSAESIYSYGWGDGGGGCDADMCEFIKRYKHFPGLPDAEPAFACDALKSMSEKAGEKAVVWKDELYLEAHRGVMTTKGELSLVECRLFTGRTHQIRAQMAHAGYPLLGDGKYGTEKRNKPYGEKGQLLYSYKLEFAFETDGGALEYLNGKCFSVKDIPFVEKYFPNYTIKEI